MCFLGLRWKSLVWGFMSKDTLSIFLPAVPNEFLSWHMVSTYKYLLPMDKWFESKVFSDYWNTLNMYIWKLNLLWSFVSCAGLLIFENSLSILINSLFVFIFCFTLWGHWTTTLYITVSRHEPRCTLPFQPLPACRLLHYFSVTLAITVQ